MKLYYAGIGARRTPDDVLTNITKYAKLLNKKYILRSGGAEGADTAFELGSKNKQIFVPWDNFNNHRLEFKIPKEAYEIAKNYHPMWSALTNGSRILMARNVMQIMGPELKDNSKFVLCWTQDGCQSKLERTFKSGGTGMAIALASDLNIPIYNLANNNTKNNIKDILDDLLNKEY